MMYAIVDIETTGGHAAANGITEIAIVIHDGKAIIDYYETLINPGIGIPYFIQRLTGITNEMVAKAPTFQQVAHHIHQLLAGKVFVAHNVNFDYSFVKYSLAAADILWDAPKLCTVRLSRKIIPGYASYSLGKLCHALKINHQNHHRAGGDALATATLFEILLAKDTNKVIKGMLKGRNKEQYLPPHLATEELDALPQSPGVYYFYNNKGKVIYVGKAINIFKRVKSHFSNNKTNKQKQDFLRDVHRVSFKECATELMAHILESTEIRKLWPQYNRSQRGYLPRFGLFVYEDRQGFKRLAIEKSKSSIRPVYTFNTLHEGHQQLRILIDEFSLCPRLCNIAVADCTEDNCTLGCQDEASIYNQKTQNAIVWLSEQLPSFAYVDKGLQDNEQSCILIRKGNLFGMGYITDESVLENITALEQCLEPLPDNDFIRNLVYKYAASFPEKCISF